MGKVVLDMAMSLDGFIAGLNHEDHGLHHWYFAPTEASAEIIDELIQSTGALIMGRQSYDMGAEQGGFVDNPYPAAHFIVTHQRPEKVAEGAAGFTFVTDGIESALRQAQVAAGDKDVVIGGGAKLAQQFLKAGLIDEIQLHLIPKLFGEGLRLFDQTDQQIELESTRVVASSGVTHLKFRVVR